MTVQLRRRVLDLSSDGFGFWLAGLIDGEGSFTITPNRPGFTCRLTLGLRDDDSEILTEIRDRTGLGRVLLHKRSGGNRQPLSLWRVERKADCQALCAILDAFPLRSKKSKDYAIWREAVDLMAAMTGAVGPGQPRDWSAVAELKEKLADVRRHPNLLQQSRMAGSP